MKKNIVYILILTAIFATVYVSTFDPKLDLNGDNATYIELARNLSDGMGYSTISPKGVVPASHFPPGYSAFLSVFMSLGIDNLVFFKALNGILLFGAIILLWLMLRQLTARRELAFSIAVLTSLSPLLLTFSSIVMSEMLYMFCASLALFALWRYTCKEPAHFWRSPWFWTAVVAGVAAYYIRSVGASVIFAIVIFFLMRRQWMAAGASMVSTVALIAPWSIRNATLDIHSRYFGTIMTVNPWRPEQGSISSVGEMVQKMLTNIDETVIKGFREVLFPWIQIDYSTPSNVAQVIAGMAVVAIIFYGAWRMKPMRWALWAFLLANIGLFALWHGGNGSRYVVPVIPIIYACFYYGCFDAAVRVMKMNGLKLQCVLAYAVLIMAIPVIGPLKERAEQAKQPYPSAYQNYFALATMVQEQLPAGTVVCCRKPELFRYYAPSMITVNYIYTLDADELIADLVARKVDFVILEQLGYASTARYLWPAIESNSELFGIARAYENPPTYLLSFEREKARERLIPQAANTLGE